MKPFLKSEHRFTALPLFFQVFAIACSYMFTLAVYGFVTDYFREARVFYIVVLQDFLFLHY